MPTTYYLPPAEPIAEPRTFPLHHGDRFLRGLSRDEADYRAGVLRHELHQIAARRRALAAAGDRAAAHDLEGQERSVRTAWSALERQRRYGYGARGVLS